MEIAYLLPALRVMKDEVSKKYSFIDVFSVINIPKDQEMIPQFFFIGGRILGATTNESAEIDVRVVHENGTLELARAVLRGPVKDGDVDIAAYFGPTLVSVPGKYYFRVIYDGTPLEDNNKYFFTVVKQQ